MNLVTTLEEIGLEEREVKVYLALLELNESTVLPIATKAGIKRTYTYDILESLQKKGLVSYIAKNGRRRYIAEDPKKLEQILKDRLERFRDVLPEIRSVYNQHTTKPIVRFYEGAENVKPLYEELAHTTEFATFASPDHFYDFLGKEYVSYLTKNIVKNKTRARELLTYSYTEVHFAKEYQPPLQEVRLLPEALELNTDMILLPKKLILVSFEGGDKGVHAISIEGSSIVDAHQKMFDLVWSATGKGVK